MKINNNYSNDFYKINFKAMKKTQFSGVDFAFIEKYKAPIEKFKMNIDLQNWAKQ